MHVGVWTSLPVRNNQTWVHFHQNLSIFVIFQDFFQYPWASSRLFFNTLNKNTTVKTGKLLTRLLSVLFFALCCREKPASLFSSPEKRTLSSCKEGFWWITSSAERGEKEVLQMKPDTGWMVPHHLDSGWLSWGLMISVRPDHLYCSHTHTHRKMFSRWCLIEPSNSLDGLSSSYGRLQVC